MKTVLAAGELAAPVVLAQPTPLRRTPTEASHTRSSESENCQTRSFTAHRRCRVLGEAACRRLGPRSPPSLRLRPWRFVLFLQRGPSCLRLASLCRPSSSQPLPSSCRFVFSGGTLYGILVHVHLLISNNTLTMNRAGGRQFRKPTNSASQGGMLKAPSRETAYGRNRPSLPQPARKSP